MADETLALNIAITAQETAGAAFAGAAGHAERLGKELEHAGQAAHGAAGGLHEAGEGARHGGEGAHEAEGHLGKLREALLDVGKVAGGLVAGGVLTSLGHGIAEQFEEALGGAEQFGASVYKLQTRLGGSAEEASALVVAMQDLHIDVDAGTQAFSRFERGIQGTEDAADKLASGGKGTGDILKAMGVAVREADGKTRPFSDVLGDVADKFKEMPDGVEKTARAQQLFGRAGADLIPLLNLGKEGLEEVGAESRKYGLQLSGENVAAIRKFSLAHNEMNMAIEGARLQIGVLLIPILTKLVEGLTAVVTEVLPAVRGFLGAHDAAQHLHDVLTFLDAVVGTIAGHIRDLTQQVQGNKLEQAALVAVITPIAALLTAMEVKTIALEVAQLAQTVATKGAAAAQLALNLVMEANPIGLVILALSGLAVGLIYAYQTSDTFRAAVDSALRAAGAAFSALGRVANDVLGGIEGFLDRVEGAARGLAGFLAGIHAPNISIPIPGHAAGGPVGAGSLSIVGEQGPELFVPSVAGSIVPNSALGGLGGRGVSVHVTVTGNTVLADDSQTARQLARILQPELNRLVTLGA